MTWKQMKAGDVHRGIVKEAVYHPGKKGIPTLRVTFEDGADIYVPLDDAREWCAIHQWALSEVDAARLYVLAGMQYVHGEYIVSCHQDANKNRLAYRIEAVDAPAIASGSTETPEVAPTGPTPRELKRDATGDLYAWAFTRSKEILWGTHQKGDPKPTSEDVRSFAISLAIECSRKGL